MRQIHSIWNLIDKLNDRNKFGLLFLVLMALIFHTASFIQWRWAQHQGGQWAIFDSQNYYRVETFPDGIRFDYPKSWSVHVFPNNPPHTMRIDSKIMLREVRFFSLIPPPGITIYFRRSTDEWDSSAALAWYLDDVQRGTGPELQNLSGLFQAVTVGQEKLPAQLLDIPLPKFRRDYVVTYGDEAFVFVCDRCYLEGESEIFQRFIDSIEIYE